ncbi:Hypothetical protein J6897_03364 [Nakaseomyces glabratus]
MKQAKRYICTWLEFRVCTYLATMKSRTLVNTNVYFVKLVLSHSNLRKRLVFLLSTYFV